MTGFVVRKHQRLKELIPVRYYKDRLVGDGLIKDLSLNGSSITGNARVFIEERLILQLFVPGDPEPLTIDGVMVKWVKGSEFGVEFGTLSLKAAERLATIISGLVTAHHGASSKEAR